MSYARENAASFGQATAFTSGAIRYAGALNLGCGTPVSECLGDAEGPWTFADLPTRRAYLPSSFDATTAICYDATRRKVSALATEIVVHLLGLWDARAARSAVQGPQIVVVNAAKICRSYRLIETKQNRRQKKILRYTGIRGRAFVASSVRGAQLLLDVVKHILGTGPRARKQLGRLYVFAGAGRRLSPHFTLGMSPVPGRSSLLMAPNNMSDRVTGDILGLLREELKPLIARVGSLDALKSGFAEVALQIRKSTDETGAARTALYAASDTFLQAATEHSTRIRDAEAKIVEATSQLEDMQKTQTEQLGRLEEAIGTTNARLETMDQNQSKRLEAVEHALNESNMRLEVIGTNTEKMTDAINRLVGHLTPG